MCGGICLGKGMENKRFALLIDADNISAKYIGDILEELSTYGITTYKRIYGDWTSTQATKWKSELLENSVIPVQQFSNTVGKNATDSTLIIDAMDILYTVSCPVTVISRVWPAGFGSPVWK